MASEHRVVSREEWLDARRQLLLKEKELTRLRDEVSQARRELPWEKVEKPYQFSGPSGTVTLGELFQGAGQLIVYHFMFHPDAEAGCPHCSLRADGFNGIGEHLKQRDTTLAVVSRAPYPKLAAYRERMGWRFPWVSSYGTEFNADCFVSFTPEEMARKEAFYNYERRDPKAPEREGHSVFVKDDEGAIFHSYSCYDRGNDMLAVHYQYLDITPKGRDEGGRGPYWVRRRDEYAGQK